MIRKTECSRFWPKTKAEVLSSECIKLNPSKFRHSTAYKPIINCRYEVNNKEYVGGEINRWANLGMDATEALELTDQYPEGKQVIIYYNPEQPAEAFLKPGTGKNYWMAYLFGCFFIVAGCYMGYTAFLLLQQG